MYQLKHLAWMLVIILVSLSLAITLTLVASPFIYQLSINWFDLTLVSGLTADQLMENYTVIIDYLVNPFITTLQMPFFSSSPQGLQHFADVKVLFLINFAFNILSIFAIIFIIKGIRNKTEKRQLLSWFPFAIGFPLILLFIIVVAFDQLFILFHQLLFTNDYWLFDPALDPVITVLPEPFFMMLFILAILIYEIIILLLRWLISLK